jgi:hypothetical protein
VTTIGLAMMLMAEPLTIRDARRASIAKGKRKRVAEYCRTENLWTACTSTRSP